MAYLPTIISELSLLGLAGAGQPNAERIIIRPTESTNLAGFGVAVGKPTQDGGAQALYDNIFWFPAMRVAPPAWIILYTGKGVNSDTVLPNGDRAHLLYWQRPFTVFTQPHLAPILFKAGYILIGSRLPG